MSRRKVITRVIVFLLLGAIVNVAVAWGIGASSVWESGADYYMMTHSRDGAPINNYLLEGAGHQTESRTTHVALGLTWSIASVGDVAIQLARLKKQYPDTAPPAIHNYGFPHGSYDSYSFGFPRLSMTGLVLHGSSNVMSQLARDPVNLLVLEMEHKPYGRGVLSRPIRFLPLRPIWPGFAINTVFYAVTLSGLFAAPFALRRWRRIKRGLCPACAYPVGMGASPVCTECGARVPLSLAAVARERG